MLGRHLVTWLNPRDGGNGLCQDVNKTAMIAVVLVLALFLGLPCLQFLVACSMKNLMTDAVTYIQGYSFLCLPSHSSTTQEEDI